MSDNQTQMQRLLSAVATMTDEVQGLKREVVDLTTSVNETKEIVKAWEAVKLGGKFIKWLGGLASFFAGVWLLMKIGVSQLIGGK